MKGKPSEKNEAKVLPCVLEIEKASLQLLEQAQATQAEMADYYPKMLEETCPEEVQGKADSLKRASGNIAKAFAQVYEVSDEFSARWKDIQYQKKSEKLRIPAPANTAVDLSESKGDHFAKGLNLYKILLICFVGSFAGVVVELIWCLLRNGYLESRSGLVYGPFNLLYGAGAVALTLCLYQYRNRGAWLSFAGGMIVGSVIEYLCSWGQELIFGSRSWDYSHMPFNLNGRICLLYSIFWGFLGIFWIKAIYPIMSEWILKLPNRVGKIATWVLVVFFVFNSFMTVASVARWTQRMDGVEPSGAFAEFLDERFPDERMERVFANMKFMEENHESGGFAYAQNSDRGG